MKFLIACSPLAEFNMQQLCAARVFAFLKLARFRREWNGTGTTGWRDAEVIWCGKLIPRNFPCHQKYLVAKFLLEILHSVE